MSDENNRYSGPNVGVPSSLSPYPVSRLSAPHDLVDTAREIQKADQIIVAVTTEKLGQIADQIRALQEQARDLLERARRDAELHRADCRFQKVAGQTYHLYRRTRDGSDRLYFSILSPADWKGAPPDPYEGSYRLEADATFTPQSEIEARDARARASRPLLGGGSVG